MNLWFNISVHLILRLEDPSQWQLISIRIVSIRSEEQIHLLSSNKTSTNSKHLNTGRWSEDIWN